MSLAEKAAATDAANAALAAVTEAGIVLLCGCSVVGSAIKVEIGK